MAGFDKIQNGLIFGAVFGALVYYVAASAGGPAWISWYADIIQNIGNWLVGQSWWTWSFGKVGTVAASSLNYMLSILLGAGIGAWIDAR